MFRNFLKRIGWLAGPNSQHKVFMLPWQYMALADDQSPDPYTGLWSENAMAYLHGDVAGFLIGRRATFHKEWIPVKDLQMGKHKQVFFVFCFKTADDAIEFKLRYL